MDKAVSILTDNAEIKAHDTMTTMWSKTHSLKLWSGNSTANYVRDICESMLCTSWENGQDWKPRREDWYRWLVAHRKEDEYSNEDEKYWG